MSKVQSHHLERPVESSSIRAPIAYGIVYDPHHRGCNPPRVTGLHGNARGFRTNSIDRSRRPAQVQSPFWLHHSVPTTGPARESQPASHGRLHGLRSNALRRA